MDSAEDSKVGVFIHFLDGVACKKPLPIQGLMRALVELASPKTMMTDLEEFNWYCHFEAYALTISSMPWSSFGEQATRARSSAYIGAPQKVSPTIAPRPEDLRASRSSSTKTE